MHQRQTCRLFVEHLIEIAAMYCAYSREELVLAIRFSLVFPTVRFMLQMPWHCFATAM